MEKYTREWKEKSRKCRNQGVSLSELTFMFKLWGREGASHIEKGGVGAHQAAEKAVRPRMWREEWWRRVKQGAGYRESKARAAGVSPGACLIFEDLSLRVMAVRNHLRGHHSSSQQRAVIPHSGDRITRTPQTRQPHGLPRCVSAGGNAKLFLHMCFLLKISKCPPKCTVWFCITWQCGKN